MRSSSGQLKVASRVKELGNCIELVSIDPHFHQVSVGLFIKSGVLTVFSYSRLPGIEDRIEQIRDRCIQLGDVKAVDGTNDQLRLISDLYLDRALRFMFTAAVEKDPAAAIPTGRITAPDTKTKLTFVITGAQERDKYVYTVSAEAEAERAEMPIRAAVGGFIKYSNCERVDKDKFSFEDGRKYDNFARLILPLARNVSAVEAQLEQEELSLIHI